MITLDRFILESEQAHPGATGELSLLLMRFGMAGKRIARELAVAGLRSTLGSAGEANVQGEEQKKLDVLANDILLETFDY
ncbi:MAG TPA: class 1 fructose-bisphosphatase, partial [Thermoanaerobaculia bacterium]